MNFEIWCVLEKFDWNSQQNDLDNLLKTTVAVIDSAVNDEGIYKAKVKISIIEYLIDISKILDDDLVMYGADSDILMTVKTMKILGLD